MLEDTKTKNESAALAEGETDVANGKAAFEANGNDRFKYSKLKS
jgi:hypothetical protein